MEYSKQILAEIEKIQSLWHDVFGGDDVPNDDATSELMKLSGSWHIIAEAFTICREKEIQGFKCQYAYVCGIIRNKKASMPKKWTGS